MDNLGDFFSLIGEEKKKSKAGKIVIRAERRCGVHDREA